MSVMKVKMKAAAQSARRSLNVYRKNLTPSYGFLYLRIKVQ